jgi:hypothetical protein
MVNMIQYLPYYCVLKDCPAFQIFDRHENPRPVDSAAIPLFGHFIPL